MESTLYGISDDSTQRNQNTYVGVTAQQQTPNDGTTPCSSHSPSSILCSTLLLRPDSPSIPSEPAPITWGIVVTIRGANGYSVTGQAILDFAGTYPQSFLTTKRAARSMPNPTTVFSVIGPEFPDFVTNTKTAKASPATTTARFWKVTEAWPTVCSSPPGSGLRTMPYLVSPHPRVFRLPTTFARRPEPAFSAKQN